MEDSQELKFKWHKSALGMGMRNKGIVLFTICYNPVVSELKLPKDRGKINLTY